MASKKKDTNELIYKTETDSQTQKANLRLLGRGRGREGMAWDFFSRSMWDLGSPTRDQTPAPCLGSTES